MGLQLVTKADIAPVKRETLKQHLRIDHDAEDELIDIYLGSAVAWVEDETKRKLMSQTWDMTLDDFPRGRGDIALPFGKCSAVKQITYYDGNGSQQTLSGPTSDSPGTGYQEDLSSDNGGRVRPPIDTDWPSVQSDKLAPVVVRFVVGYTASTVPMVLKQAVMFRAADYYSFRGAADEGDGTMLANQLVQTWRIVEF